MLLQNRSRHHALTHIWRHGETQSKRVRSRLERYCGNNKQSKLMSHTQQHQPINHFTKHYSHHDCSKLNITSTGGANSQLRRQRGSRVHAAQVTAHELFDPQDREYVEMLHGADPQGGFSGDAEYEPEEQEEEVEEVEEEEEQQVSGFDLVARLLQSNRPSPTAAAETESGAASARLQEGEVEGRQGEAVFEDEPPLSEEELERIFRVPDSPEAHAAARKYFVH